MINVVRNNRSIQVGDKLFCSRLVLRRCHDCDRTAHAFKAHISSHYEMYASTYMLNEKVPEHRQRDFSIRGDTNLGGLYSVLVTALDHILEFILIQKRHHFILG